MLIFIYDYALVLYCMSEPLSDEEIVERTIIEFRNSIDVEKQVIKADHDLFSKLSSWIYVLDHLDQNLPDSMKHLHELNGKISDLVWGIMDFVQEKGLEDLKIEKEEEKVLEQLKDDVNHKDWRAVNRDIEVEKKLEEESIRLEEKELKELHSLFDNVMTLIKEGFKDAIEEDAATPKQKHEYERQEEYYFMEMYKFAKTYEDIFRHLLEKEKRIREK